MGYAYMSCLILDDDIKITEWLSNCLFNMAKQNNDSLNIYSANDPLEAINIFKTIKKIDILVIDYHFKAGMNGEEFLNLINKKFDCLRSIIMISGRPSSEIMPVVVKQLNNQDHRIKFFQKPLIDKIEQIYFSIKEPFMKHENTGYIDFELIIDDRGFLFSKSIEGERDSNTMIKIPEELELTLELIKEGKTSESMLEKFGKLLYNTLFHRKVEVHFNSTEAVARSKKRPIRLRLTITSDEFAILPWEFLYREEGDNYLGTNPDTVLSRYLNVPMPQKPIKQNDEPLRMLIIISNPKDQHPLEPKQWEDTIFKSISQTIADGKIKTKTVEHATYDNITQALLDFTPDIVQFVGHGAYFNHKGHLALVNKDTSGTWLIDDVRFADIFLGHHSRLGLVCLATCESATSDSPKGFLGVAPKLVQRGISAVVAMQYPISISSAEIFLENFYKAIAARKPVDWAVQHGRNSISINVGRHKRDFAIPVLYMRAKDGNIF